MTAKRFLCPAIWLLLIFSPHDGAQKLTVTSRLVQIPVLALGPDGRPLQGLRSSDFLVYDNGAQQTLTKVWTNTDAPLSVGLVLDVSGSQLPHLIENRELLIRFLQDVVRPHDYAFLEIFDSQARFVSDSTGSIEGLGNALRRFSREPRNHPHWVGTPMAFSCQGRQRIFGAPCGNSVVWNAVVNASDVLAQKVGRRAIVLVTDGEDSGSNVSVQDALKSVQNAGIAVFAVALPNPFRDSVNRRSLEKLAKGTGGNLFDTGSNAESAFSDLNRQLRSEYVLEYKPSRLEASGQTHALTVYVSKANVIQYKTHYTEAP